MNELDKLRQDSAKMKSIREAVALLRYQNVFNILRQRILIPITNSQQDNAHHVAAARHYEVAGYSQCLRDLEDLAAPSETTIRTITPDFGAREKLLEEGYTEEEISTMLNEGESE